MIGIFIFKTVPGQEGIVHMQRAVGGVSLSEGTCSGLLAGQSGAAAAEAARPAARF